MKKGRVTCSMIPLPGTNTYPLFQAIESSRGIFLFTSCGMPIEITRAVILNRVESRGAGKTGPQFLLRHIRTLSFNLWYIGLPVFHIPPISNDQTVIKSSAADITFL